MLGIATLFTIAVAVSASVIPVREEGKVGDADFLKKQKQVLDLFLGLGNSEHVKNEHSDWDMSANLASFTDEKYPKAFMEAFKCGKFLPMNAIFAKSDPHSRRDGIKLFDVFFFAKDFDTFIKAASWAKAHVNPGMFIFSYSYALTHRKDCQSFHVPPAYELFPSLFVPSDTMHQIFDHQMTGDKEGQFNYNNSGYEFNAHTSIYGGVLDNDKRSHGEYRISYFREDVGLNEFWAQWIMRNPFWMAPGKYYESAQLNKRGENFFYALRQIFARYTLERTTTGLPFVAILKWFAPVEVGYNPRVTYLNGKSMYVRPDGIVRLDANQGEAELHRQIERRVWDVVDQGSFWEESKKTYMHLEEHGGFEILGRIIYGTDDRPSPKFYRSLYYTGLDALAYVVTTGSDRSFVGNALSLPATALRDPLFYQFAAKVLVVFDHYKNLLGHYSHDELIFNGVTVQNVEVDKLLTFFDHFHYEATNGLPMEKSEDYINHKYEVRQYRLNHKPYNMKISVNSEKACDAMVRVFLGPALDSNDHRLNHEQGRIAYFEIDRFPAKLTAGANMLERSSKDSPFFVHAKDGFRALYTSINSTQLHTPASGQCGFPERLQLPKGWKGGRPFVLSVVVTPYDSSHAEGSADIACGGTRLNDGKPMGFPFDRPIAANEFKNVPNIYFQDVYIYHKDSA